MYLRHCLPGSEDLCDLILVAGQKRFPAHSQYLASHSHFIKQLILETGPFSWQHPLIIDQVLHGHSSACVHALLNGVYNLGSLFIDSPDLAWQLSKLTDLLNCRDMLRDCRLFLNQMPMCQPDDALHWMTVTAHEAELEDLHANCASKIAADFDRVAKDKRLASLPTAHLMRIMAVMSQQNSQTASQPQADKQMCQICSQSEQQAFRLGRKRKLLAAPLTHMGDSSASEESSSDSESESEEDAAAAAVAVAACSAAPLQPSSSDDNSGSEEEEGPDAAVAAAAAAGDAVIAAVAGLQREQSSEESESEEESSSEDGSLPGPQVAVGNKPASEESSSSEEESPSEDESKPGPQAGTAADDSSSEEESLDEESSDRE